MTDTSDLVRKLRDPSVFLVSRKDTADYIEELEAELDAANNKLAKALEAGVDVAASLNAAISLLERGGKKAAASDKIFAQMLVDYNASLDRFRTTLAELTGGQKDE